LRRAHRGRLRRRRQRGWSDVDGCDVDGCSRIHVSRRGRVGSWWKWQRYHDDGSRWKWHDDRFGRIALRGGRVSRKPARRGNRVQRGHALRVRTDDMRLRCSGVDVHGRGGRRRRRLSNGRPRPRRLLYDGGARVQLRRRSPGMHVQRGRRVVVRLDGASLSLVTGVEKGPVKDRTLDVVVFATKVVRHP